MSGTAQPAVDGSVDTEPFAHLALGYRGEAEYLAGTLPFITDGVAAAEPVLVAVPTANLALLRAHCAHPAADHVSWLDLTEAGRNPGRIIPGVLRAFADAHPDERVRIIGEPIWPGRTDAEYPACVQHEALVNYAFRGRPATILCPYDAEGLDARALADAAATHPAVCDAGGADGWRHSDRYAPEDVLDAYNRPLPEPTEDGPVDSRLVDVRSLPLARHRAAEQARRHGLSAERVADVELAITELLSNSIEHGSGSGVARIWSAGDDLVCEVWDAGRLSDPLLGQLPVTAGQQRGRGLLLVNQIADLVRLQTDANGTTVRAHFRRR
ncbi:MAG TPA: sensor histidine kinase [Pseudonocardiaceae bacterium]|nr:sensor histidine kinase [Pseudonocardiaceae bacterium]